MFVLQSGVVEWRRVGTNCALKSQFVNLLSTVHKGGRAKSTRVMWKKWGERVMKENDGTPLEERIEDEIDFHNLYFFCFFSVF